MNPRMNTTENSRPYDVGGGSDDDDDEQNENDRVDSRGDGGVRDDAGNLRLNATLPLRREDGKET